MKIIDECISCNACIDECPSSAIQNAGANYEINGQSNAALSEDHPYILAELCDDCKTCVEVCPVDSIAENEA